MLTLLRAILDGLVDKPEKVLITQLNGEKTLIMEVSCEKADVGKIIGKSGKTINAIRAVLNAAAIRTNQKVLFEVVE